MKARLFFAAAFAAVFCDSFFLSRAADENADAAPKSSVDKRLLSALEESGLHFEINTQGNAVLDFEFGDKRRQRVFIRSATQEWAGLETREVASFAYKGVERPSPEVCERLLKDNARKKLGAWELLEQNSVCDLMFVVKIPADADAKTLGVIARGAAAEADAEEKNFSVGDEM